MSTLAVVTIAAGRHDHLRMQWDGLARQTRPADLHVVVAMGDPVIARLAPDAVRVVDVPRVDGLLPLAAARNAGVDEAVRHGADSLVLLDVDCIPATGAIADYADALDRCPDAIVSGDVAYLPPPPPEGYRADRLSDLAEPHPARPARRSGSLSPIAHELFWSLSFALRADTWQQVGGFCTDYRGYGGEDTDFAFAARDAGIPHLALGGAQVFHQWHESSSPPVEHLDEILANGRVFRDRWGTWPMQGWLDAFRDRGLVQRSEPDDDWVRTPLP